MADINDKPIARQDARSKQSKLPPVVAIGASAGGVQALQTLFDAVPDRTGACFVVILHLDPQSHSDLAGIIAARTQMPVTQVQRTEKLQPDHVYVIPPDRLLQVTDGEISAAEFDKPRGQRTAIDLFFRSAADRIGDGFAVILTGAGSDGSIGVRAIKEAGGIVLVQDPNEAEYPSMPRAAIATGVADFVLPVRALADRLVELIEQKQAASETPESLDDELLTRIFAHVNVRTGHDFSRYKRATVLRRILRRMQVTRSENLKAYCAFMQKNAAEAQALFGDLLISVTTFFRDSAVFEALKAEVLPQLFVAKDPEKPIRVWVPGCATGEEAYSIGILLLEEAARHDVRPPIQIFATDLDTRAIAVARQGLFPNAIETDVTEDRLRRFFVREPHHYLVGHELRDLVLFANHSILKDPPFSHLDLISCRNVLIYLDRELQDQVLSTFRYALNVGGYLLLGPSETADSPLGLFRTVNRAARIYQSTAGPDERPHPPWRLATPAFRPVQMPIEPARATFAWPRGEAAAHQVALEKLAPPSILIDTGHNILHMSETAGRFMQPAGGPLSADAVDMVRPELRAELRAALVSAFEQQKASLSSPIPVRFNGIPHRVELQVKPVSEGDRGSSAALVFVIEGEPIEPGEAPGADQHSTEADKMILQLNQELKAAEAQMRAMREEWSASNEELRASNEELQSMNEEYRSTSEELETSREELQSTNEELLTVNGELKNKLDAVSRANSDLQNLIAATEVATLFVDSGLRIQRFTERVIDLFSIAPGDEGRMITDFTNVLEYDDLAKDAQAVLADLSPIRREVRSRKNAWYDVQCRPYRTVDDKIDGVVITFFDVTERHNLQDALEQCQRQLKERTR
jgi:two-component system, chemotaxis family, CheB/CheR fusion protein